MCSRDVVIDIEADRVDVDPLAAHTPLLERALREGRNVRDAASSVRFMPQPAACDSPETVALLTELSHTRMRPENAISISQTCYLLIRETERIVLEAQNEQKRAALSACVPPLRRALEMLADFVLRFRHDPKKMDVVVEQASSAQAPKVSTGFGFSEPVVSENHRQVVWAARARVERALRALEPSPLPPSDFGVDPQRRSAAKLTNGELARWAADHGLFERSLLSIDDNENVVGHSLQSCGLMALWTTIKQTIGLWPRLPCTPHVFRLVDELRTRTHFFLTYRESTSADSATGSALRSIAQRSERQVMGLSLELWRRPNHNNRQQRTLLNMPALVQFTAQFAHVNMRFVIETERVFASFDRALRQLCGFRWHRRTHANCKGCAAVASASADGAALLRRFEQVCASETVGVFKDALSGAFRARVYNMYVSPSVAERFRHYNPADTATARSIISREAPTTYRTITERYVDPQVDEAWSKHLQGRPHEPAYSLFAAIAAGYFMKQRASGLKLEHYVVDVDHVLDPHLYCDERRGFVRRNGVDAGLHIEHHTTSTLRFRNRQAPAVGIEAPLASQMYEHPLIVRSMNSTFLYYKGTMHRCDAGFHQAFAAWLECMCIDEHIGGQSGSGSMLHDAWRAIASPSRRAAINEAEQRTRDRLRRWDPIRQVFNCDEEIQRVAQSEAGPGAPTQF